MYRQHQGMHSILEEMQERGKSILNWYGQQHPPETKPSDDYDDDLWN